MEVSGEICVCQFAVWLTGQLSNSGCVSKPSELPSAYYLDSIIRHYRRIQSEVNSSRAHLMSRNYLALEMVVQTRLRRTKNAVYVDSSLCFETQPGSRAVEPKPGKPWQSVENNIVGKTQFMTVELFIYLPKTDQNRPNCRNYQYPFAAGKICYSVLGLHCLRFITTAVCYGDDRDLY